MGRSARKKKGILRRIWWINTASANQEVLASRDEARKASEDTTVATSGASDSLTMVAATAEKLQWPAMRREDAINLFAMLSWGNNRMPRATFMNNGGAAREENRFPSSLRVITLSQ